MELPHFVEGLARTAKQGTPLVDSHYGTIVEGPAGQAQKHVAAMKTQL